LSPSDRAEPPSTQWAGPARHELPLIDERGLVAARAADVALAIAEDRGQQRWVVFLRPLPDRFRDGDLRDLRSAAMRGRAAFGPKDSIRDVLPGEVTEPLLEALDRLLRELNRYDWTARLGGSSTELAPIEGLEQEW
jgi:hypothetical protein